jgi:hypothetical protein
MSDDILRRCKTCEWWGCYERKSNPNYHRGFKICGHPKNEFVSRRLDDEAGDYILVGGSSEPVASDAGSIIDGSGYWVALIPGPDFVCIHWEPSNAEVKATIEKLAIDRSALLVAAEEVLDFFYSTAGKGDDSDITLAESKAIKLARMVKEMLREDK